MCDEKQQVISVLRALLVSKAKKGPISLFELGRDYCSQEGKTEIPKFGYKNVRDFLRCSGEFVVNEYNHVVLASEIPKLESLRNKKLVTEQRSCVESTSTVTSKSNFDNPHAPIHTVKPSIEIKFDGTNNNEIETVNQRLFETTLLDSENEIKSENNRKIGCADERKSTAESSFDMLKSQQDCSVRVSITNKLMIKNLIP